MKSCKLVVTLLIALPLCIYAQAAEADNTAACSPAAYQVNHASQFYQIKHASQQKTANPTNICTELAVLMPRLGQVTELSISADKHYVVFTHNGKELWLYSRLQKAVRLLEFASNQRFSSAFSPQWSADSRWLLYTSFKNDTVRPRVFSVDKKRQYALPVQANDYSTVAWRGQGLAISIRDFVGDPQQLAGFQTLGISLTKEEGYAAALANRERFHNTIDQ